MEQQIESDKIMWMVFLFGSPGVGKLTVAKKLCEMTDFRLFHNHMTVDLVESVFEFGSRPFIEIRELIWLSVFETAAREGQSLIFTFAPERTVRTSFPGETRRIVEEQGGRILFVELHCPELELERRIELPERTQFNKLKSKAKYRELRDEGIFQSPKMPVPDMSIDTGLNSPSQSAKLIRQALFEE